MREKTRTAAPVICFLLLCTLLAGCGRNAPGVSAAGDSDKTGTVQGGGDMNTAKDAENGMAQGMTNGTHTEADRTDEHAVPRAIQVDGTLYFDTGYNSSIGRCGVLDGEIASVAPEDTLPSEDGQCNFSGAVGWQTGSDEGTVDVYMEDHFRIFAKEGAYTEGEIPSGVAHFMAVIQDVPDDGDAEYLWCYTEDVPDDYVNLYFHGEKTFAISIKEYQKRDPSFGVSWTPVTGGVIEVVCDAEVENPGDTEQVPYILKHVYHIFRIGSSPMQPVDAGTMRT